MRKQVELTFVIGLPSDSYWRDRMLFEKTVVSTATALCGGCAVEHPRGYWREDGAEHKTVFDGEQSEDYSIKLSVTCEMNKWLTVYYHMKKAISLAEEKFRLGVDWVHVKRTEFTGMHFSVKKEQARRLTLVCSGSGYKSELWPVDPNCPKRAPAENQAAYDALCASASPRDASHRSFMRYSAALDRVKDALGL